MTKPTLEWVGLTLRGKPQWAPKRLVRVVLRGERAIKLTCHDRDWVAACLDAMTRGLQGGRG